jgi:hypothetical protein
MFRWIILLAIGIRLLAWALIPGSRFASDEESYYRAGVTLAATGQPDLFWPPFTPWIIAAVHGIAPDIGLKTVRFLWVAMDVACLLLLRVLAVRAAAAWRGDSRFGRSLVAWVTIAYAVYLPAISHAQFTTSETPALLQLLLILVLVTRPGAGFGTFAAAGIVAGTLTLTRPSLAPLLVTIPAVLMWWERASGRWLQPVALAVMGAFVVAGYMVHNRIQTGEFVLAHNSAYNLYIGNRDVYTEDLNLFSPRATPEQIAFRQAFARGEEAYPTEPPAVLQRRALEWIADHPATFARRAVGRMARVFAPKTDVLELAGGEGAVGVWSPKALALLGVANVQWLLVLALSVVGVLRLWSNGSYWGPLLVATVAGASALCAVAIAKPRYAFVFEPLLMIGAAWFVTAPRVELSSLQRATAIAVYLFLAWAWIAWAIFAVTSRP